MSKYYDHINLDEVDVDYELLHGMTDSEREGRLDALESETYELYTGACFVADWNKRVRNYNY